ncbi:unnamed protein product [Merluccius merluccius]
MDISTLAEVYTRTLQAEVGTSEAELLSQRHQWSRPRSQHCILNCTSFHTLTMLMLQSPIKVRLRKYCIICMGALTMSSSRRVRYERLQRTRALIPPLPRSYQVHRPGNLHPLQGLSKDLSHSQVRPLSLGSCEGYDFGTTPSFLLPSALVLNKRNTFSVDSCQLNRPKVTHRTYNLLTIKDIQKGQGSYPDPMAGAPHSFLHRVSELSCMEGETARQERLGKLSKNRKQETRGLMSQLAVRPADRAAPDSHDANGFIYRGALAF